MNFQTLTKVETAQTYLDNAFRAGQQAALRLRGTKKHNVIKSRFDKSRNVELVRIEAVRSTLLGQLGGILRSFPSISSLPEFYLELVKITLDSYKVKKALAAINWGRKKI